LKIKIKYLVFIFFQSAPFLFSGVIPNLDVNYSSTRSNSVSIIAIMVEFEPEVVDDPRTTGDGTFLLQSNIDSLVACYGSEESRCNGFLVDRPPHNASYFEDQIKATKNYYLNISKNNIDSFEYHVIDSVYQLERTMSEYSEMSSYDNPEESIAFLYSEGLELASFDIESLINNNTNLNIGDVLIVMFHAGVGEDYTFEGYLDPANYDIRSGYIEESMLGLIPSNSWMKQNNIAKGILLPEGLNLIYYDTIDDIYGCQQNMLCDVQIGMTGLFSYLLGYEFGLSEMFNRTSGKTGIGQFGLMDIGSFNLRGTLPSPPNPWSRLIMEWDEAESVDRTTFNEKVIPSRYSIEEDITGPNIYRLDISESEYYLIENVDNYLTNELAIDDIFYSDSLYSQIIPDSAISIFDRLLFVDQHEDIITYSSECDENSKLTISDNTNVILCAQNYDYGLPGRGLIIWHINELYMNNLNDNIEERTVKIIEADGAQDIGYQNYMYPIANPSVGWKWDLWFPDNDAYFFVNDDESYLNFNSYTNPASLSDYGARTYINIYDVKYTTDSSSMKFTIFPEQDVFIAELISDSTNFEVIGAGIFDDSGCIIIDNTDAGEIQIVTSTAMVSTGVEANYDSIYFGFIDSSFSLNTCLSSSYYDLETNECLELNNYIARGYFSDSMNLSDIPEEFIEIDHLQLAIGDIDQDGIDEILKVSDENISCFNKNGVSCNNFPLEGNFHQNLLIADIMGDMYPELIVRNNEEIQIISYDAEVIHRIPSEFSTPLYMIPNWGDYIALVDGKRKLLLNQSEALNGYWLNPGGLSNNQPDVNPLSRHTLNEIDSNSEISEFYNYPNPVKDGSTTFRYFLNTSDRVEIKIYSSSGFFIKSIKDNSTYQNEYNEIVWNSNNLDSGVYLANLIAFSNGKEKDSKIIKVLVVNE